MGTSQSLSRQASDLVIDINGYFAPPDTGGLSFFPLAPCRVLDTRNPAGALPFNGKIDVNVGSSGCAAPASAQSFVLNATVVPPGPLGFLTLWPQGATQPLVSTLNAIRRLYYLEHGNSSYCKRLCKRLWLQPGTFDPGHLRILRTVGGRQEWETRTVATEGCYGFLRRAQYEEQRGARLTDFDWAYGGQPRTVAICNTEGEQCRLNGGESGIRTHVRVSPKHAFQACAFSHSAISPAQVGTHSLYRLMLIRLAEPIRREFREWVRIEFLNW